jgi:hypothetical protein
MKLKFDVSASDPAKATGSNFEPPPAGTYNCRIDETTMGTTRKGDQMITAVYEIIDGQHKGKKLWDRIVLTKAAEWKLDQFLQALGVASSKKRKGVLDLEEIVGERLTVKVKQGEYNGNPTAEVDRVSAAADSDDLDDYDEDEDDDEDLDSDEDVDDDVDDDLDEEDEEDEEDDSASDSDDDYESMSLAELRAELKERELNAKGAKPSLIARLRENDEEVF